MLIEKSDVVDVVWCLLMLFVTSDSEALQQGVRGHPKSIKPFHEKCSDDILSKLLGMPEGIQLSCVQFLSPTHSPLSTPLGIHQEIWKSQGYQPNQPGNYPREFEGIICGWKYPHSFTWVGSFRLSLWTLLLCLKPYKGSQPHSFHRYIIWSSCLCHSLNATRNLTKFV